MKNLNADFLAGYICGLVSLLLLASFVLAVVAIWFRSIDRRKAKENDIKMPFVYDRFKPLKG